MKVLFEYVRHQVDLYRCKRMIKKNSMTFYKAFSHIEDRRKKEAIYAVYAFCRYADDLIDDYKNEQGLNDLEESLIQYVQNQKTTDFRFRALKSTTKDFYIQFDYKPFFDMIKGQRMDLYGHRYQTIDELLAYCYHVAGTVGLMLTPIIASKYQYELKEFAIRLGYAMQITNILRDVGEDFHLGRIYLPQDILTLYEYTEDDIKNQVIDQRFINVFEHLAKIAEEHYLYALKHIERFDLDAQKPLGLAIVFYRAILDACREASYDVFHRKNFVSLEKKNELMINYIKQRRSDES